jgi:alcohol dehydrogenase class IV
MFTIGQALANDASSLESFGKLTRGEMTQPEIAINKPSTLPILSIPTSLSGGEYSNLAGGTHPITHRKQGFIDGACGPSLTILSPELSTTTPDAIWLSTGIRAVDHCVEGLCSITNTTPASDASCEAGLRLLVPGLLRSKRDAGDLEARLQSQLGVIEAVKAVFQHGVPLGASHGIGHQLGPLGVGHGETSCILLPAVCKYNVSANAERQAKVSSILWSEDQVASVLRERGLIQDEADLGDVLDAVIKELGLPRSLKSVGVQSDEELLQGLAKNSLQDPWCVTNPRPLERQAEVMKILAMVAG